jgi:hypothetical protein
VSLPLYRGTFLEMQGAGAEQTDQSDHDQIDRNNDIEQTGYCQYQDAGDQRYDRGETQMNLHGLAFLKLLAWQAYRRFKGRSVPKSACR